MINGRKAILLALLNQGEISSEVSQWSNIVLQSTDYAINVFYTAEKPITYNRNMIVKKFLENPDYDYLMMVDSDIVPPDNYFNLIDFEKDIISGVCFVYAKKKVFPLVLKHTRVKNKGNKYRPYDSIDKKKWDGLMEVDGLGTGAIIISRKVLEAMPYPFQNVYNKKDGDKLIGNDFHFCVKARKLGFKLFCHTDYICSHFTRFDLRNVYYTMQDAYQKQEKVVEENNKLKKENDFIKGKLNKRQNTKRNKTRVKVIGDNNRKESCDGFVCKPEGENVSAGRSGIPEVQSIR
jgi:hypothetical protein